MHLHQPSSSHCPFCNLASGGEDSRTLIWRAESTIAFPALHQKANHAGSLILCPTAHFENIYVLPERLGAHLFGVTKNLALALKAGLHCEGVSVRQHNEPAGGQDVWHYHIHVVPRYNGDDGNSLHTSVMSVDERVQLAERVRAALAEISA